MTQDENTPIDLLQRLSDAYAEINKLVSLDSKGAVPGKWFAILSTIADAKGAIIDSRATTPPPALEGVEEELRALLEKAEEKDFHDWDFGGGKVVHPLREFALAARNHLPALLSALAGMRTENERLRAELRQHVIFRPFGRGEEGTCIACGGEWKDGTEAHKPGCLAEAKP